MSPVTMSLQGVSAMNGGKALGWRFRIGAGVGIVAIVASATPFALAAARAEPSAPPGIPADVTFTKHVAPILQRSCENCHRPDGVAPMSLVTYEDVRPWARAIKQRTGIGPKAGVMPPWYVERNIGIQT